MPPLNPTRSGMLRGLAQAAAEAVLGPLQRIAAAGSRLLEPSPILREPKGSVRRGRG